LSRFRDNVISEIVKGRWKEYISKQLSHTEVHDHTKIDLTFPYNCDDNLVNRQLRKNEYLK
jgi:hypothetical protein